LPAPHILVVGGTGMLAGLVERLAGDGGRVSLISRQASAFRRDGVAGHDADWNDEAAFVAALEAAGPIDLAVAWFHSVKLPAARRLAERVRGRMFQVLGSAANDPAHPSRLALARQVADGLPDCALRQVVLGFKIEAGCSRWLTNAEISNGVFEAVRRDRPYSIVGVTEPWSSRP
jgi:hypothetical protein